MTKIQAISIQPSNSLPPRQAMIIMHGLGTNGNDMLSLSHDFSSHFPDMLMLFPHAPFEQIGEHRRQWFSVSDHNEILRSSEILGDYIDYIKDLYDLKEKDIILSGFSQGAMMALYTGITREEKCKSIIAFSGLLPFPQTQPTSKPRSLLIHGAKDEVIPISSMNSTYDIMQKNQFDVTKFIRPNMAHSIDNESIDFAINFLKDSI